MRYIDRDGDTWETYGDGSELHCVARADGTTAGGVLSRIEVEDEFGPLIPLDGEEPQEAPSQPLPTVEGVMTRATVFQAAHALVKGLEWGEPATVYDVLQVTKWLEAEG
ncbi:hypothetical protein [Streptomyces silvensis]|uniref:Uncharacterized protein n=1 Tax=Streptomyces silvensis TaxID=1765722 RepID=A0A0W7X7U1_9ACTN|nr:hypothetical protein [Streptomyces silvensis]KUF18849.1 hypothetical protein AT728_07385 [Streptomyces silvensis]